MTARGVRSLVLAVPVGLGLIGVVLAGCGAPPDGTIRPLDSDSLPYNLTSLQPTTSPPVPPEPVHEDGAQVWLVRDKALVATAGTVDEPDPTAAANDLLRALREGPTDADRARGLSSALAPDTWMEVTRLKDGQATVEVRRGVEPPADQLPLATGQIVLTVTSLPGIDAVLFTRDGEQVQAPLPGGARTSRAVDEDDYRTLLAEQADQTSTTP